MYVSVCLYICTNDNIRKGTNRTNLDFRKGRPPTAVGNLDTYLLYHMICALYDSSYHIYYLYYVFATMCIENINI